MPQITGVKDLVYLLLGKSHLLYLHANDQLLWGFSEQFSLNNDHFLHSFISVKGYLSNSTPDLLNSIKFECNQFHQ